MDMIVVLRRASVVLMLLGLVLVVSGSGVAAFGGRHGAESAGLLMGALVVLLGAGLEHQAGAIWARRQRKLVKDYHRRAKEAQRARR